MLYYFQHENHFCCSPQNLFIFLQLPSHAFFKKNLKHKTFHVVNADTTKMLHVQNQSGKKTEQKMNTWRDWFEKEMSGSPLLVCEAVYMTLVIQHSSACNIPGQQEFL